MPPVRSAWFLAAICTILLVTIQISYQRHTYLSYQPAQCFIIHKEVVERTYFSKSTIWPETYYEPEFVYAVYTSGVYRRTEQGYHGPDPMPYIGSPPDLDDAQGIVGSFQLNKSYPCWYSPEDMHHAYLVLYSDIVTNAVLGMISYMLGFFGIVFFGCILYRFWRLKKKGIRARGHVVRHERPSSRSDSKTSAVVAFRTNTEPALKCVVHSARHLRTGKGVSVLYDPADPQGNATTGDLQFWPLCILFSFCIFLMLATMFFLAKYSFFI